MGNALIHEYSQWEISVWEPREPCFHLKVKTGMLKTSVCKAVSYSLPNPETQSEPFHVATLGWMSLGHLSIES